MSGQAELAAALLVADLPVPRGLVSAQRFAVHRNNVVTGLIGALEAAYPAVRSLVGDGFFAAMAGAYVRADPPRSPVLIHYGEGFPAFIEGFPPAAGLPYLGAVARLERAWLEAFHAAEAVALPVPSLGRVPAAELDDCRLVLHPSLRVVAANHPIVALWAANTGRGSHAAVDLGRAETALVVRPEGRVTVEAVPAGLAALAGALGAGMALGAAVGTAFSADPAFDPAAALGRLFALGSVVGIRRAGALEEVS